MASGDHPHEQTGPTPSAVGAQISTLERGGALRPDQAERLLANWWSLRNDWWQTDPFLFGIGEHSRVYLDDLRRGSHAERQQAVADAQHGDVLLEAERPKVVEPTVLLDPESR